MFVKQKSQACLDTDGCIPKVGWLASESLWDFPQQDTYL
jgi:hypothetical protein